MRIALNDLKLDRLWVVYPGERRYVLADGVEAVSLHELAFAQGRSLRVFQTTTALGRHLTSFV